MKVAFTGTSGSGKTTLVKWVAEKMGLNHISGSAGDVKSKETEDHLQSFHGPNPNPGHYGVILHSAESFSYGYENQLALLHSRKNLIEDNNNFVTDRSPLDNLVYCISQVGFHPQMDDSKVTSFFYTALEAFCKLTHVIYVPALQPISQGVENNGSRINNWWYQQSIDAAFQRYLMYFMNRDQWGQSDASPLPEYIKPESNFPKILILDMWNLDSRKEMIENFLEGSVQSN